MGSFGPLNLDKEIPSYGHITSTPKPGWRNYPIVKTLENDFGIPIGFNTDVNAAALGEAIYGVAKGSDSCLYITFGTGIGAGAVVHGKLLQGLSHLEMGHILVRRHLEDEYEGLASGPAIEARWGIRGVELTDRPEACELQSYYIAQAIMEYLLILSLSEKSYPWWRNHESNTIISFNI
ncbi:ROK family protein [Bacillus sp. OK048]|nr:ROK family protein [Bacillus sp. OK048]